MKEQPDIQISGIGCLALMVAAIAFFALLGYQNYLESNTERLCIERGGKMIQTSKWYESVQKNCVK